MDPTTFIPVAEVTKLTSLSRTSIYRAVQANDFPEPVLLSPSRKAWVRSEIDEWQEQRIQARKPRLHS